MAKKTAMTAPFIEQFAALDAGRSDREPVWLTALRRKSFDDFQATGLPDRKTEAWKYTNLNKLAKIGFKPAGPLPDVEALPPSVVQIEGYIIVFVNGRYEPALSSLGTLPEGIVVESLRERIGRDAEPLERHLGRLAPSRDMPLTALNLAFAEDGIVLRVAPETNLEQPIHIVSIGCAPDQPTAFHMRSLVEIGAGSSANIFESHIGSDDGTYFSNSVCDVRVDHGARLGHYRLQNDNRQAFNIGLTTLELARGAHYDGFSLQLGAALARNEVRARIGAEEIECRINGAYLATGTQQTDNTTFVDHAKGGSQSRQVFRGVLDDHARGVFQGKVLVEPQAQKTDGHQLSRTLLLSRSAEMDCKPELEIYADDVKCSHGATVGELDEEALFYIRSRGIDSAEARDILVQAFVAEAIEEIGVPAVREAFDSVVEKWLNGEQEAIQ